jgi:cytochrome c oxidase cbb3-type subunit I/II
MPKRISVLRTLGTPYPEGYEDQVFSDAEKQAKQIAARLKADGIEMEELEKKEIIAMIAYLQRLGTDIKPKK